MKLVLYFLSQTKTDASVEKLLGVRDRANRLGWHVQTIEASPTPDRIAELINFWKPVGIILESGEQTGDINLKCFGSTPVVCIDRDPKSLPATAFNVIHDSFGAGLAAARDLLLSGVSSFAFVPHPGRWSWSDERRRGFEKALALNGKSCAVLSVQDLELGTAGFHQAVRNFLAGLPRPTAVFVANDRPAEAVLVEAEHLGLKIPQDLTVLGVDDYLPICEHTRPTLSSVKPAFRQGGQLAADLLAAVIRDGKSFRGERLHKYGTFRIVHRASTRRLPGATDHEVAAALDLIRSESCNGLTAERVYASFSCSRPIAAARFRKATGHTVLEEIHEVRLDRVKDLLANPNQRLKDLADFCGFANANSLRRMFLRKTGKTMSAWRAESCKFRGR